MKKIIRALLSNALRRTRGWTRIALIGLTLLCFGLASLAPAKQSNIEDYATARRVFWSVLYADGGETLYCGYKFKSGKQRALNIEHVVPMSWATRTLKCGTRSQCRRTSSDFNRLEADLHNLYPSLRKINDERGSFKFAMIPGEKRSYGACDFEVDFRKRTVEPRPAVRGRIARTMFYMKDTYDIEIFAQLGKRLLQWHRQYPPTDEEKRRNAVIDELQGTRNKYIDSPDIASKLRF